MGDSAREEDPGLPCAAHGRGARSVPRMSDSCRFLPLPPARDRTAREEERMVTEDEAMRRAIALAARGLGTTSPNPVVGCLLLDAEGEVVGEGFHAYAGGPHAEIVALAQAGERARGGTAVVTLEPCNHTGRTGPCAQALINAGHQPGRHRGRRPDAGRGRRGGLAAGRRRPGRDRRPPARGGAGQRRLADRRAPRPAVRDLEVRRDAGRPLGRRRRHQPVDHLGRRPAPTCTPCAARWTRSSPASAPCSPTTPS